MRRKAIAVLGLVCVGLSCLPLLPPQNSLLAMQDGVPPQTTTIRENPTDAATRLAAWEQHRRMDRESPFAEVQWRAVGPQMQGGRIESIAVPAGETTTFYVGVGSGNLWKTVNSGITWTPVFEKESTFTIGDVAVAESNPNVVWVGTGEVLMARSSYAGTGVFKSLDGGETWRHMGLADTHHIGRVVIHPTDPDVVYVAAIGHLFTFNEERGLFKTVDGGESWEKVLYINDRVGVIDLVMDPTDPQTLYATTWERSRKAWGHTASGEGSGIYKTTDGGESWDKLTNGFPTGQGVGRIAVDVAPSNPDVVYALLDNHFPDPNSDPGEGEQQRIGGEVYRSDDRGDTWRKVNQDPVPAGYDFCIIKVAPDDENVVYVPGLRFWASEDGGRTYRQIEGTLVHLLPHGSKVLHLDHHDLWINPQDGDHMLLGNDGGFHISYDRGESWLHVNNLPIGEFYAVHLDMQSPYNIYGGTQDNAALWGPSDHVVTWDVADPWQHVYLDRWGGGDSYFTYPDPTDPNVIYYEHQFGELRRKDMVTDSAARIRPVAEEGQEELRTNWMTPFFISRYDPRTLYYGANILFKSLDRGDTWRAVSPDLTSRPPSQGNIPWGTLTTLSESPLQQGLIYAGADDGFIHVTRDDGGSWTRIDGGLPDLWVSRVEASGHQLGTVYVSLTGYREDDFSTYLYASEDFGESWRSIASDLPMEPVNVVREDPTDPDILYVGTDLGVFVSLDRGTSWHSLSATLPTTPVYDLVVHPRDGEIVIGTHGRSVWVADVGAVRERVMEEDAKSGRGVGAEARLAAWELHREMAESSPFRALEWQRLGPKFAGGRIESIDAPRGQPGTIYVGVGAGGVWKTVNGGLTFDPVFEYESTFAVGDLTVSPSDPGTIWVGTGEAHLSGTSYGGTGVFKSTDEGRTWTNMGLHQSGHIGKVVVDPNDGDVVYVAAMGPKDTAGGQRGVYKTTDGGVTFRQVLPVGPEVSLVDLVLDPTDPTRLLAAAWDRRQQRDSGVYRSTDAGESWERLGGGLLDQEVGRVALDASASEPGVFYALIMDHSPEGEGRDGVGGVLFRSPDGGDTWKRTHDGFVPTYVGWDFCDVRVSPDDANEVYIAGLRLLVSHDGGETFKPGGESVFRLHHHQGTGMHLDMHDIWIDPENPSRILLGNDGGLYVSWDRAQTWLHLNNLPIAEFYRVHLDDSEPFHIWGGTQDNASLVGPSSARFVQGGADDWEHVFLDRWAGGDGFSTFPDPHDSTVLYYTQQQGDLKRARRGELTAEKRIRPMVQEGEPELRWAWDTPFLASEHGDETRLYSAAQMVFASDDRGESWKPISPDLGSGQLLALSESPLDPMRLVAGGGRGELHFTQDGGRSWRRAGEGLPEKTVRDVVTSLHDEDRVYVTLSGTRDGDIASYVYVTSDFGETWEAIGSGLPYEPVNAIVEDPRAESVLFVGTDLGVFASTDFGAGWVSLGHDLPTAPVVDLAVDGRGEALVAVTHGLSAFLIEIASIREAPGG